MHRTHTWHTHLNNKKSINTFQLDNIESNQLMMLHGEFDFAFQNKWLFNRQFNRLFNRPEKVDFIFGKYLTSSLPDLVIFTLSSRGPTMPKKTTYIPLDEFLASQKTARATSDATDSDYDGEHEDGEPVEQTKSTVYEPQRRPTVTVIYKDPAFTETPEEMLKEMERCARNPNRSDRGRVFRDDYLIDETLDFVRAHLRAVFSIRETLGLFPISDKYDLMRHIGRAVYDSVFGSPFEFYPPYTGNRVLTPENVVCGDSVRHDDSAFAFRLSTPGMPTDSDTLWDLIEQATTGSNGFEMVEKAAGLGPLPRELLDDRYKRDFGMEGISPGSFLRCFLPLPPHVHKSRSRSFILRVAPGCGHLAEKALANVVKHNQKNSVSRLKSDLNWIACHGDYPCALWNQHEPLPPEAIVMPQTDSSFFIGKDGENIKSILPTRVILHDCVVHPQVPVVFIVRQEFTKKDRERLLDHIKSVGESMRSEDKRYKDEFDDSDDDMWW